jgi:hypothetical protein
MLKHINDMPPGGSAGDLGAPTINTKNIDGGTTGWRCSRSESAYHQRKKISMTGPLGGGVGDSGAPNINTKNVDDGPLGGGAGVLGVPTINAKNVDGVPPVRRCWRSGSAHHQC